MTDSADRCREREQFFPRILPRSIGTLRDSQGNEVQEIPPRSRGILRSERARQPPRDDTMLSSGDSRLRRAGSA